MTLAVIYACFVGCGIKECVINNAIQTLCLKVWKFYWYGKFLKWDSLAKLVSWSSSHRQEAYNSNHALEILSSVQKQEKHKY